MPPYKLWGVFDLGGCSLPGKILTQSKTAARPPDFPYCSCILEGRLPTNLILSALHPEGPKSNIYVHFQIVNKQLIGISSRKESSMKHETNLEVKNIT